MTRTSLANRAMQEGPNASNSSSLFHLSSSKSAICNHACGELPNGWRLSTLGESCNILAGYGFPERLQGKTAGALPFFKVGDISEAWKRGEVHLSIAHHYLSREETAEIRARPLPKNTTVFAKIGAAIALNRRAILSEPSLVDNNVMGLHPATEALDHKFLFHFICTVKLDELSRATTVPSVRKSDIEQIELPVPPLPEQRRIVAEIEKQFTRLEAGVSALKRLQANLKRYRAAVLKAACEGKLVPTEAELVGRDRRARRSFESGAELLTRILADRRKKWQGRGQYKEPAALDTANLPPLPDGWVWASLDQLLGMMRNGISAKPDAESGLQILRISAVRALSVKLAESRYLNAKASDYLDYTLTEGDLLFTRYNGNPELVGVCGVVPPLTSSLVHPDKLIRCQLISSGALPDFVAIMANVGASRNYLAKRVRTTAGQAGISGGDLKGLPIPFAPLAEQTRIVAEVERRLSVVEELEATVSANLQRAGRLRQSILKKAITGEI